MDSRRARPIRPRSVARFADPFPDTSCRRPAQTSRRRASFLLDTLELVRLARRLHSPLNNRRSPRNKESDMNGRIAIVSTLLVAAAQPALAQQDVGVVDSGFAQQEAEVSATAVSRPSGAPSRAWEIGVGVGYSQGAGDI